MATENGLQVSDGSISVSFGGTTEETMCRTLRKHIGQHMIRLGHDTGAIPVPNTVPTEYLFVNNQGLVLKKGNAPVTVIDLGRVSGYLNHAASVMLQHNMDDALQTEAGKLMFQQLAAATTATTGDSSASVSDKASASVSASVSTPSFEVKDAAGRVVAIGDDEQSVTFGLLQMIRENLVRLDRTRAAILKPSTEDDYLFVSSSNTQGAAIFRADAPATLDDSRRALSYLLQVTVERLDSDLAAALTSPAGQQFLKWKQEEEEEPKPDNICVFVESPYSKVDKSTEDNRDAILRNVTYLNWCFVDSQARGEMPVASHMTMTMHPMSLDRWVCDYNERYNLLTRDGAIERAQALRKLCARTVFYMDRGMSKGMRAALKMCKENGWEYELRRVSYPRIARAYPKITTGFFNAKLMLKCVRSETLAIPYTALFGHNMTLALAKPDVSDRFKQVESVPGFQQFKVVRRVQIQLTRAQAELFYEEHKDAKHFAGLVDFMVSGPVIAYWLTKAQTGDSQTPPAFRMWRELCGPTNPADAKAALSNGDTTIRGIFGTSLPRNAVHGSDSVESATRELNLFFKDERDAFSRNSGSCDVGKPTLWTQMREAMFQCLE